MKKITWISKLNQTGDTIIEVLIVLAVLGLAFAVASVTAHDSLTRSRNAQEHSVALGIIGSQIEWLRSAAAAKVTLPNSPQPFCMTSPTTVNSVPFQGGYTVPPNAVNDTLSGASDPYPAGDFAAGGCIVDNLYHVSLVYSGHKDLEARVRWEGAGRLGNQQELMDYRVYNQ